MFPTAVHVSHHMHSPLISWEGVADPETALKRLGFVEAPKIVCSLLDHSEDHLADASVPGSDSDCSISSITSSSPKSNRSSFPTLTSDDYPVIQVNDTDSTCHGLDALTFNARSDIPPLSHGHDESPINLGKYRNHGAAPSNARASRDRPSFSTTVVVNLTYPDNLAIANRAPKRKTIGSKVHFQVLIGSLAQSLSIFPELIDLTIQQNSQLIKLSPIASPHQLGFSGGLTVQVWVRELPTTAPSTLPASLDQPRRIPGTKWIHSFPSMKYKFGLPSCPKYSGNPVSI
ncbi:hypothetical protein PTTG_12094 [Puccinia triticina 1-1 BBBD Race 1]|uniref:Uncharacterized protein n=2 Tax=Puccinia triticina TaxID=208348 RepID=A0A180GI90_PUCT1|nr:uncharacterized protein PtA15_3A286 [Puccinia triticina]OAV92148.1 hypothetical protein PTTG_12094 [Puccinia triticina 1-1 BBBD Race 1]WAQ82921.1 hypothetical protein PtA15_3A286 [Puccinia triticina]